MDKYEYISHTADIKFKSYGKTIEECFSNATAALINIICKQKIKAVVKKEINVKGKDHSELLYNLLEEFLYLLDSKDFISSGFKKIKIKKEKKGYSLNAVAVGDDIKKYSHDGEVKAITYNEMFVKYEKDLWSCQVVVDV
jgi:SHS2 domain-containing protein